MRQQTFVMRRKGTWERLETLVALAARRGVRRLSATDIADLGRTYRATTSDLAYARGSEYDAPLVEYLNRLVARAHAYVYGSSAESGGARLRHFFVRDFPVAFRGSFAYVAICIAITLACSVVA